MEEFYLLVGSRCVAGCWRLAVVLAAAVRFFK